MLLALISGEFVYLLLPDWKLIKLICYVIEIGLFAGFLLCRYIFKRKYMYCMALIGIVFVLYIGASKYYKYSESNRWIEKNCLDGNEYQVSGKICHINFKDNKYYYYISDGVVASSNQKYKFTSCKIIIVSDKNVTNKLGMSILCTCTYREFRISRNEGNFNERDYYYGLGISGRFNIENESLYNKIILDGKYSKYKTILYNFKNRIINRLNKISNKKYAGIFCALLVGDKSNIPEDIKEIYEKTGISHILSISGLHISIIGAAFFWLLRKKISLYTSVIITMVFVYSYGIIIGTAISAKRAVIMFMLGIIGKMLGRTYDIITALSLALIFSYMDNPGCLLNISLDMSYGAVLAIIFLANPIIKFVGIKSKIIKSLCFSEMIGIFTRPILANSFYRISIITSSLNVFVVPLMSVIIIFSIIGVIISFISIFAGRIIYLIPTLLLWLIEVVANFFSRIPYTYVLVGNQSKVKLIIYYVCLGLIIIYIYIRTHRKNKQQDDQEFWWIRYSKKIFLIMIIIFSYIFTYYKDYEFTVKILDVGQGDCILINDTSGKALVSDLGSSSVKNILNNRVLPTLEFNRIQSIEYLLISHSDSDHINGAIELIKLKYNGVNYVKNIVLPKLTDDLMDEKYKELVKTSVNNGINVIYATNKLTIEFEDYFIRYVYPNDNIKQGDKNDMSGVFYLEKDSFTMLFTGDISNESEKILKQNNSLKKINVLKVSHHGSKSSSSDDFLNAVRPDISIISCGINNIYGHPGYETIERLKKVKSNIFRTDFQGQITIKVKKNIIGIKSYIK